MWHPHDPQTLALDVIGRIAKAGNNAVFPSHPHTFAHFRQVHFLSELPDRSRFEAWEKAGGRDLFERCNQKAKELLPPMR
ncbi:MAG: trimethylamine methyltransferase family protein [Desulfobacterales bacterium]|nr:trimethylamine methyltransferase family protein [Desulfobacterales bacterium]